MQEIVTVNDLMPLILAIAIPGFKVLGTILVLLILAAIIVKIIKK